LAKRCWYLVTRLPKPPRSLARCFLIRPLGWTPKYDAFSWNGLEFEKQAFYSIMNIDRETAHHETNEQKELFTKFGHHLPREMEIERELQFARLYHSPSVWDLSVTGQPEDA
jgi:phosphoenolpyruvate carboxykinase (GTP)